MMQPVLRFANRLRLFGLIGLIFALAVLFFAPFLNTHFSFKLVTMALATLTAGASLYLLFESVLFRHMASFDSELTACYAMDDFLFRAGLRKRVQKVRKIEERIAGTRKIISIWTILIFLLLVALLADTLFPNTWSHYV